MANKKDELCRRLASSVKWTISNKSLLINSQYILHVLANTLKPLASVVDGVDGVDNWCLFLKYNNCYVLCQLFMWNSG